METTGSVTTNSDMSKNMTLGLTNGTVSGNAFVNGNKDGGFTSAGANLGLQKAGGGASVQATHIPSFGNQVTASANANLVNNKNHNVNVNAFHTNNMPKAGPNFATHGAGVNYNYKDTVGIGASTAHTPMFKMHQHSVTGNVNLHSTPTSSLNLNVGASQTTTPFGRSGWQPGASMVFKKQF